MISRDLCVMTEDKQKVYFDHHQSGHDKIVIIAHGFFNSKNAVLLKTLAGELNKLYDVIVMDFRGHGKSSGMFLWTSKEYLDLQAVVDFAKDKYSDVGVIGFSLGAATSIITASHTKKIKSLIAVSAPMEFGKIEYQFWDLDVENDLLFSLIGKGRIGKGVRPGPFWLKKQKPIERVAHVAAPTLFIHGEKDWLIYPEHSRKLYEKAKGQRKIVIIKNGPHAEYLIRKNKEETISLIIGWFHQTL